MKRRNLIKSLLCILFGSSVPSVFAKPSAREPAAPSTVSDMIIIGDPNAPGFVIDLPEGSGGVRKLKGRNAQGKTTALIDPDDLLGRAVAV